MTTNGEIAMQAMNEQIQRALLADEISKHERWAVTFNEFCEDGFIRPVKVHPRHVTCVRSLVDFDFEKYRTAGPDKAKHTFDGGALLVCDGREIAVFESLNMVFQALGAMLHAADIWATPFYSGMIFEDKGINYFPEIDLPTQPNELKANLTD